MREIKFRAWDIDKQRMIIPVTITSNDFAYAPWSKKTVHWILMQFTGLKDKNGREIYEGDILAGDNTGFDPYKYVVEWDESFPGYIAAMIEFEENEDAKLPLNEGESLRDEEVIGNIYENPELLKEDSE